MGGTARLARALPISASTPATANSTTATMSAAGQGATGRGAARRAGGPAVGCRWSSTPGVPGDLREERVEQRVGTLARLEGVLLAARADRLDGRPGRLGGRRGGG